jgi:sulfite exporter TauE/SafE
MPETGYLALFIVGLLGGAHCVGMCGGIVSALTISHISQPGQSSASRLPVHLAYNLGRIASYALAGALAGFLGGLLGDAGEALHGQLPVRTALYLLANLMLVALGLYLLGLTKTLSAIERLGQGLWQRLQPLTKRFLPVRSVAQAFPLGLLWGWLPCGLVYSALASAMTSGSALQGAGLMLAFGTGTLPNLLLAGLLLLQLRRFTQQAWVRQLAGVLILGFGVYGLFGVLRLLQT